MPSGRLPASPPDTPILPGASSALVIRGRYALPMRRHAPMRRWAITGFVAVTVLVSGCSTAAPAPPAETRLSIAQAERLVASTASLFKFPLVRASGGGGIDSTLPPPCQAFQTHRASMMIAYWSAKDANGVNTTAGGYLQLWATGEDKRRSQELWEPCRSALEKAGGQPLPSGMTTGTTDGVAWQRAPSSPTTDAVVLVYGNVTAAIVVNHDDFEARLRAFREAVDAAAR